MNQRMRLKVIKREVKFLARQINYLLDPNLLKRTKTVLFFNMTMFITGKTSDLIPAITPDMTHL
jgi:hypothetical protein